MANCKSREGVIISVEPNRMQIRLDPEEGLDEGGGCSRCAMRGMCHGRKPGSAMDVTVRDANAAERRPGERVRVRYVQANPALAATIMFLPALAGLMSGGFAANRLFGEGNGIFLAGAGGGLVLGLFVTFAVNRIFPSLGPKIELTNFAGDCAE